MRKTKTKLKSLHWDWIRLLRHSDGNVEIYQMMEKRNKSYKPINKTVYLEEHLFLTSFTAKGGYIGENDRINS